MPNSARGSACGRALGWWRLGRLEDLCAEVCPQPPRRSIATAIGCLAFLRRTPTGREISEVLFVDGWDGGYVVREIAGG